jgi:hypothetical protein
LRDVFPNGDWMFFMQHEQPHTADSDHYPGPAGLDGDRGARARTVNRYVLAKLRGQRGLKDHYD